MIVTGQYVYEEIATATRQCESLAFFFFFFLFLGCPNTGKSSLLNAVVGRKNLLMTSKIAVSHVKNREIRFN